MARGGVRGLSEGARENGVEREIHEPDFVVEGLREDPQFFMEQIKGCERGRSQWRFGTRVSGAAGQDYASHGVRSFY